MFYFYHLLCFLFFVFFLYSIKDQNIPWTWFLTRTRQDRLQIWLNQPEVHVSMVGKTHFQSQIQILDCGTVFTVGDLRQQPRLWTGQDCQDRFSLANVTNSSKQNHYVLLKCLTNRRETESLMLIPEGFWSLCSGNISWSSMEKNCSGISSVELQSITSSSWVDGLKI